MFSHHREAFQGKCKKYIFINQSNDYCIDIRLPRIMIIMMYRMMIYLTDLFCKQIWSTLIVLINDITFWLK